MLIAVQVIYGGLVGTFANYSNRSISESNLMSTITKYTVYFIYLAIVGFLFIYIATIGFYHTGERIVRRLRRAYIRAIIRQNMAFFDSGEPINETANGSLEINDICFWCPSRPQQLVLDHSSLSIQPGQYIVIVGPSGSGKKHDCFPA